MATARLSLDEVHDSIHTHDLKIENLGKSLSRSCWHGKFHETSTQHLVSFQNVGYRRTLAEQHGAEMSEGINAYIILVKNLLEGRHVVFHTGDGGTVQWTLTYSWCT